MRRTIGLLVISLTLIASCGSETTVTSGDNANATTVGAAPTTAAPLLQTYGMSELVLAASDSLVAHLGVDEAGIAVLLALDHGYSFNQLMNAAANDTLGADGTISGIDPDYGAYDLLAAGGTTASAAAGRIQLAVPATWTRNTLAAEDRSSASPEEFMENLNARASAFFSPNEKGRNVIALLYHLSSLGYSFEQITNGILFGEVHLLKPGRAEQDDENIEPCFGLIERARFPGDERVSTFAVTPTLKRAKGLSKACEAVLDECDKGEDADLVVGVGYPPDGWGVAFVTTTTTSTTTTTTTTTTAPEVALPPFPWTFTATEEVYTTLATVNEIRYGNVWEISITLREDGTLEYIHRLPANRTGYAHNCPGGDLYLDTFSAPVEVTRQGTHGDGRLSIPITYADNRTTVQEGSYTKDAIRLDNLSAPYELGCEDLIISMMNEYPFDIPRTAP